MKIFSIILFLFFITSSYSQSAYSCKNVVEISKNGYCKVYLKCGPQPQKIMSEGTLYLKGFVLKKNFHYHRHGIWIIYDSSGSGIARDTLEFYYGNQLGEYEFTSPATGLTTKYSIIKEGNSTITYFDEKGRKTEEVSFDLNENKMQTHKIFFDRKGNVIREETWIGKKLVK